MSSSDRRFRRAVGRVLIALSFKHSREHGGRGAGDAHLLPSPSCGGDGHHRPGAYCPSSPTAADHRQSSSPPSHYCAVVLPSPAHFIVRTALLLVFLPTALWAYYNCDTSTIRVRFDYDSATTRYEVFRALAYEIVYENQW